MKKSIDKCDGSGKVYHKHFAGRSRMTPYCLLIALVGESLISVLLHRIAISGRMGVDQG
jgi:hypothetical protein